MDIEKLRQLRDAKFSLAEIEEIEKMPVRYFVAQFIEPGVCGYKEQDDDVLLRREVLFNMAPTFYDRAVLMPPHNTNITSENIMKKSIGRVVDVWKDEFSDRWFVKFQIWDKKALIDIDEGKYPYVSCCYIITERGEGGRYNGEDYAGEVLDGFYHHIIITDSPRYTDSDIVKVNEELDLKFVKFNDIVEFSEEKQDKGENKMFFIKKSKVEIDKDICLKTNSGELSIEEIVAKFNECGDKMEKLSEEKEALSKELEEVKKENKKLCEENEKLKADKSEKDDKKDEKSNEDSDATKPAEEQKPVEPVAPAQENNDGPSELAQAAAKVNSVSSEAEKNAIADSEPAKDETKATVYY
jgi:regulator of replication initiation timing